MTKHQYFGQAASWAGEHEAMERRSRKAAWLIAGVAVGIAAFEAVALAMLVPLKRVEPIMVLVDRQTGFVETIDPAAPRRLAADDALTQSLLAQYVSAREGFDRATASADYRRVGLWSAGSARQAYVAGMQPSNPASPFGRYPAGTVQSVRVKSVSRIAPNLALVRFATALDAQDGRRPVESHHVATVRYRFIDAAMSFDDRLTNPLGFQVTGYRREAEAPEPPPTVVQSVAVAGAPAVVPSVAGPAVAPQAAARSIATGAAR